MEAPSEPLHQVERFTIPQTDGEQDIIEYFDSCISSDSGKVSSLLMHFAYMLHQTYHEQRIGSVTNIHSVYFESGHTLRETYDVSSSVFSKQILAPGSLLSSGVNLLKNDIHYSFFDKKNPVEDICALIEKTIEIEQIVDCSPKTGGKVQGFVMDRRGNIWSCSEWIQIHAQH